MTEQLSQQAFEEANRIRLDAVDYADACGLTDTIKSFVRPEDGPEKTISLLYIAAFTATGENQDVRQDVLLIASKVAHAHFLSLAGNALEKSGK